MPMAEDIRSQSPSSPVTGSVPTPTPSRPPLKIGDRPHLWTVALSTAAIVISVLSYFESHRSRLLNEELNRPLVRALSAELIGPVLPKDKFTGSKMQNAYALTFRNSGKAF